MVKGLLKSGKTFGAALIIAATVTAAAPAQAQIITTVAGDGSGAYAGDGGPATAASIHNAYNITPDHSGNLLIADYANYCIRKVTPAGIITTIAGNGTLGYSGDGGPATAAQLNCPACIAIDAAGNLYIADMMNSAIRKINTAGIISTVAGNGARGYSGDGGPATAASICFVYNLIVDAAGNLYLPDEANSVVRKVSAAGIITTIAGCGVDGNDGDGGQATAAKLSEPWSVALDATGNLFIADLNAEVIRKVTPAGVISTIAGNGVEGYSGDGGPATAAAISNPTCIITDRAGNVYIDDYNNSRIRKVTPAGVITTVVGTGVAGFSGDGGAATDCQLDFPTGIAFDASENMYISDLINERVRKVNLAALGVNQATANETKISVFPNPNKGVFTVALPGNTSTATVTVFDMNGKTVAVKTTTEASLNVDLSGYPTGLYLVNVNDNFGQLITVNN